jgi:predicted phage terminase large subunit-like protein
MTITDEAIAGIARHMLTRFQPPPVKEDRKWPTPGVMACALDPSTVQTPALKLIDDELRQLADSPDVDKLIITMPPQEGKSVRVSHRFPEWLLEHNPDLRIAIVSYTDEMARRHGAEIKLDAEQFNGEDSPIDLGIKLRQDSRAAGRWGIKGHKGGIYCVGIGGSLTGKPVDILIIDDPIKNMEQAHSAVYRQKIKDFWQAVAIPRLGPGAKCVIIQTRWHEDDLAGWLQVNEPGQWRVINVPAQAESFADPLGRKPGEFMVSARGARSWAKIKKNVGSYVWAALYQGCPRPAAGGLFKRTYMRYWSPMPPDVTRHGQMSGAKIDLGGRVVYLDDCWRFLTVDLAASEKTSADWTAVGVWAISPDGDLILLDGDRKRIDEQQHWRIVRPLKEKWHADVVYVESSMIKSTMVYEAGKSGILVKELKADTDKVTRALPATVRAENGRLWLPTLGHMPEIPKWVDELVSFPNAAHDDCVDVVAYAARVVATEWLSQSDSQSVTRSQGNGQSPDKISNAFESATGAPANGTDYGKLRW